MDKIIKEVIKKADEIINRYYWEGDYEYIGIRVQEQEFELGSTLHHSHVWVDGEETEEELNGVCVTDIKKLKEIVDMGISYYGEHVAIVCGNTAEYGQDYGESILRDAEVVEILA